MNNKFNSNFISNVTDAFGEKGKKWLAKLPNIIQNLAEMWQLEEIKPVDNLSWNYVATAICGNEEVVLKISFQQDLIYDEMRCLKLWNGNGAIKLLYYNSQYNTMLLQKAIPGTSLKYTDLSFEEKAIIHANIAFRLKQNKAIKEKFTHVSKWLEAIDRLKDSGVKPEIIKLAKEIRSQIMNIKLEEYLCHSDLHLDNILQHDENWFAIDPKGIIGPKEFEIAAFDIIEKNEMGDDNLQEKILQRVTILAALSEVKVQHLVNWYFLRCMMSVQWFIEDRGDPDFSIKLSEKFYQIIRNNNL
jgi:streptomycin 6-kinase